MKKFIKIPKLDLSSTEREALRKNKIRINSIVDLDIGSLVSIMNISLNRAKDLKAMAEFQSVPSIGPKFAEDLIKLGYYSLQELKGKDGAELTNEFELLCGVWIDPCVEDQFRLAVHHAENPGSHQQWWDFTETRKQYRSLHGYPESRPSRAWNEK